MELGPVFATEVGDNHPETLMNHILKLMAEEVKVVKGGFVASANKNYHISMMHHRIVII